MSIKFKNAVQIISGGTPDTKTPSYWNGDIPWLSVVDFGSVNKYVSSTEKHISEAGLNNSATKMLKADDIIISARGTVGAMAMLEKPMAFNQSCFGLRAKPEVVDQEFLFYYLRFYMKNITQKSQGSVFATINLDTFDMIDLNLPPLNVQKKIAKVLSDIDAKIDNNNAICADLEGMAKLLYDYWFIQFDFPDENGKPYKSSGGKMVWNEEMKREIPEGWDVKALKGLYQIDRGLSYTSKDIETGVGVPMLNLACVDTSRNYRDGELKYHAGKVPDSAFVNAGDLMIACTDLTRERAIIGCPILVPNDGLRYTYSMDLAKISFPSSLLDEMYMYMTLRTEFYHNYIKEWASGTTVLHLNLKGIDWYNICIPPMSLQEKYATIMRDVHSKKSQILSENRDLVSLRDFLLPMLMNGQVKVKGA